jgi:hypothetical protein
MFEIVFVFIAVSALAIIASRWTQRLAPVRSLLVLFGCTVFFLMASVPAWSMIVFLGIVPIDSIARRSFGVYYLYPWKQTIVLVPPFVGALMFAIALWLRWRSTSNGSVSTSSRVTSGPAT